MKTRGTPRKRRGGQGMGRASPRAYKPRWSGLPGLSAGLWGVGGGGWGKTLRNTLPSPISLTTTFPSNLTLTPKSHGSVFTARQDLGAPLPQRQAVDIVCVAPEGPLQEEGQRREIQEGRPC